MAAKIQLNFRKIGTFGWIFSTIDAFRKERHSNLIDNTLGDKWINTKYTYSYIVENLMSTHLCGGECIEDCNLLRTEKYQRNPDYLFASADTILKPFPGHAGWVGSCALQPQKKPLRNHITTFQQPRTCALNVNTPSRISKFLFCGI